MALLTHKSFYHNTSHTPHSAFKLPLSATRYHLASRITILPSCHPKRALCLNFSSSMGHWALVGNEISRFVMLVVCKERQRGSEERGREEDRQRGRETDRERGREGERKTGREETAERRPLPSISRSAKLQRYRWPSDAQNSINSQLFLCALCKPCSCEASCISVHTILLSSQCLYPRRFALNLSPQRQFGSRCPELHIDLRIFSSVSRTSCFYPNTMETMQLRESHEN